MAIQRSNSPSEADSYERATAFLSDWIEDSLHVPNASAKVPTAAAHLQHHSHHFHGSMPDLPTGSLRRRRSTFSGGDSPNNDGAINSLVNSLRATLVLNNQQQPSNNNHYQAPLNNNNNNGRGGPSVTVKISPSCVRGLSSTNGGGNSGGVVIDNIPPLPFAAGGRQGTVRSDPTSFRRRTSSSGGAPPPAPSSSERGGNTVRSDPSSSGRGRRRSDPSRGHRKGGGESSKITKQHHSSSTSSSKRHTKKSSSRNHYDYSRRHSLDCERSLASGSASCGPPRSGEEGGEGSSSGIYYGGRVRSRTPNNERHVHWPDHSSRRRRRGGEQESSASNNVDPPPTMVVSLPWTDHAGNVGHYTGQVNQLIQPHGSGALSYDNGQVTVKGIWNNGNPSATSTSRKSSSPSTSPVVEKEVVPITLVGHS